MEEKAIITSVHPATTKSLGEGIEISSLHVSFRVVRRSFYNNQINKVTFKKPEWLSDLEPSAPTDGYLMENGQFTIELAKDDRIKQDLNITIEVVDSTPSQNWQISTGLDLHLSHLQLGEREGSNPD